MADSSNGWDIALKALAMLGASGAWLYQTRATALRGKIKADLEILEKAKTLFGLEDPKTMSIKAKVTFLMGYLYPDEVRERRPRIKFADLVFGICCFIGFAGFSWWGYTSTGLWQFAVAGVLAFLCVGGFLNAIDPHRPGLNS